ncbi:MAG: transglutaminase domain-containing protein [Pseudobutyrivibrio sp.]|uniref:Transglutaminase n=2 Tax=Pseudobutyrivibrio TaxID=46205 RepID=A0A2G3EDU1_9FIRM|nr:MULTISPECIES: transglutaminase-like domain-containing protein [Pseudobutyrivibrio]MBE5904499.1 transglutaminase domain-containing protein [Pseudobutyrivibrio sp.]NEX02133.1 transglutaminase domain-containing protein [Pseudobutyrivibrio xylanivorans]PHU41241.1 transglutaminase [Pseudobutyrivibrio ruminis]SFR76261.1 Transglutaminase-like superfamily protein [Pseudobutyrivibrio sp. NOR37]
MRKVSNLLSLIVLCVSLAACGTMGGPATEDSSGTSSGGAQAKESKQGTRDNTIRVLTPEASGTEVYENDDASIDVSNASDGYVMVAYKGSAAKVRMLIETPAGNTYNYLMDLDGTYDVFPLSEGSGTYKIGVYENLHDNQYAVAFSQSVNITLKDEYSMYLYPNAYVHFTASSTAVKKGQELAAGADTDLDVVENVYHYITKNIKYDYDKAETVESGYVPDVDETLATGKGICFDYASLMGAMLRSQGIPTRLEIGYAGTEYHAWISVYTKETGWIDKVIQFDGSKWTLMDPTLGSYANSSTIKDHLADDTYYQLKYKY